MLLSKRIITLMLHHKNFNAGFTILFLLLQSSCLFISICQAGIIVTYETTESGTKNKGQKSQTLMYIDYDKIRIETNRSRDRRIIIFDGDKDILQIIVEKDLSYFELTRTELKKMKSASRTLSMAITTDLEADDALSQEKIIKKIEKTFKGLPPARFDLVVRRNKTGKETIKDYPCKKYELLIKTSTEDEFSRETKKFQELWITDWENFDLEIDDYQIYDRLISFLKKIEGNYYFDLINIAHICYFQGLIIEKLKGLPLKHIVYHDGTMFSTEFVDLVEKRKLEKHLFEIPKIFEKHSLIKN